MKGKKYDLIVCNPPYVISNNMATLPPEFKCEPALALDGGKDGLDFVRKVVDAAPTCITHHYLFVDDNVQF
jgi:ribosomal protein L3 glutamine methyltransferase